MFDVIRLAILPVGLFLVPLPIRVSLAYFAVSLSHRGQSGLQSAYFAVGLALWSSGSTSSVYLQQVIGVFLEFAMVRESSSERRAIDEQVRDLLDH